MHYDRAHSHIDSVKVHQVYGRTIDSEETKWSRAKVVSRIKKGDRFVTLPELTGGGLRFGQTVAVWRDIFIRSIPNGNHTDDLRGLPEY